MTSRAERSPSSRIPFCRPGTMHLCGGHRNERSIYPIVFENQHLESLLPKYPDPLLHRTFGATLSGPDLLSVDDRTLRSAHESSWHRLDLFVLTQQTNSFDAWRAALNQTIAANTVPLEAARRAHQDWWRAFWDRSWINVTGPEDAHEVTQGYIMQRYMDACGGRGNLPIKYNGSIFTVGQEPPPDTTYDPAKGQVDADFRFWGGNSWFQNTRLLYWPMIAAGDYDLLAPFFKQYRDSLALETDRTRLYFNHAGAAFPETLYFWGLARQWRLRLGEQGEHYPKYLDPALRQRGHRVDRHDARPLRLHARPEFRAPDASAHRYGCHRLLRPALETRRGRENPLRSRAIARNPPAGGESDARHRGIDENPAAFDRFARQPHHR